MNSPKELISAYKFCLMRQEAFEQAEETPLPEHVAETLVLHNTVIAWQRFASTQDLEQRLDLLVEQWSKVTKPEQKAKLEYWIDSVQQKLVQEFYCDVV